MEGIGEEVGRWRGLEELSGDQILGGRRPLSEWPIDLHGFVKKEVT